MRFGRGVRLRRGLRREVNNRDGASWNLNRGIGRDHGRIQASFDADRR